MKKIDLKGKVFGRLSVLKQAETRFKPNGSKVVFWACVCECGILKEINGESLRDGRVLSCGCKRDEIIGNLNRSHSMSNSKEYKSYQHIKYRCLNKNSAKYSSYGGRGIKVCDRWIESFENFFLDMGLAPSKKHTIDRIDVNGNYELSNCRWADSKTQANNKRDTVKYEFQNENLTLSEISNKLNIPYKYFWKLFKTKNLSFEDIIERNKIRSKKIT